MRLTFPVLGADLFAHRASDDQLNSDARFVIAGFIPAIHRGACGVLRETSRLLNHGLPE